MWTRRTDFRIFPSVRKEDRKGFRNGGRKKKKFHFPIDRHFFFCRFISFSLSLSLSLFFHLIFPPPAVGPPLCVRWPFFFFLDCHFYRRFQQQKNTLLLFSCVCVCVSVCVCVCVCAQHRPLFLFSVSSVRLFLFLFFFSFFGILFSGHWKHLASSVQVRTWSLPADGRRQ